MANSKSGGYRRREWASKIRGLGQGRWRGSRSAMSQVASFGPRSVGNSRNSMIPFGFRPQNPAAIDTGFGIGSCRGFDGRGRRCSSGKPWASRAVNPLAQGAQKSCLRGALVKSLPRGYLSIIWSPMGQGGRLRSRPFVPKSPQILRRIFVRRFSLSTGRKSHGNSSAACS